MKVSRLTYRLAVGLFSAVALQSFAATFYVQTKVSEVWVREYGTHAVMDVSTLSTMGAQGLACSGNNLRLPIVVPSATDLNQKMFRDTLLMAYALKTDVRVTFDTSRACFNLAFPVIIGVDMVAQP
jgi:hypothetical protein